MTRGHAIEALARVTHVVFDKTGTLTAGQPVLRDTMTFGRMDATQALATAAAMEIGSEHAIGRAIGEAAHGSVLPSIEAVRSVMGRGIQAKLDGNPIWLGSPAFVGRLHGGGCRSAPSNGLRPAIRSWRWLTSTTCWHCSD